MVLNKSARGIGNAVSAERLLEIPAVALFDMVLRSEAAALMCVRDARIGRREHGHVPIASTAASEWDSASVAAFENRKMHGIKDSAGLSVLTYALSRSFAAQKVIENPAWATITVSDDSIPAATVAIFKHLTVAEALVYNLHNKYDGTLEAVPGLKDHANLLLVEYDILHMSTIRFFDLHLTGAFNLAERYEAKYRDTGSEVCLEGALKEYRMVMNTAAEYGKYQLALVATKRFERLRDSLREE